MLFSVTILILFTIILVTLLQNVRVRFFIGEDTVIDFDFLLFKLILYPKHNRKRKKRNKSFGKSLVKGIRKAAAFKRALDYLLMRSTLTVERVDISLSSESPARAALLTQNISTLFNIVLTYLHIKLGTLNTEDGIFLRDDGDSEPRLFIGATLDTSLSVILLSYLKYLTAGVMRVVRNENE